MAFKIATYNLHGFSQGELLLEHMTSSMTLDVIFIQEHWLTPDILHNFCAISPDYICVGISAMNTALSNDVLRGRPFGGVAVLVCDIYRKRLTICKCAKRFVILLVNKVAFVNIYLPGYRDANDAQLVSDLLEEICICLVDITYDYVVVGGDLNFDPILSTNFSRIFYKFADDLNIELGVNQFPGINNLVTHTFEQSSQKKFTNIDHFLFQKIMLMLLQLASSHCMIIETSVITSLFCCQLRGYPFLCTFRLQQGPQRAGGQ